MAPSVFEPRRISKRRIADDHSTAQMLFSGRQRAIKSHYSKYKRTRQPFAISGAKLPLHRIMQTLSKQQMVDLVQDLINEYPELAEKVVERSPKITSLEAIAEMQAKVSAIKQSLPYKMDASSDYSFLRVKEMVDDFFQLLSEYTLNYLPPVEQDWQIVIGFIRRFLTEVLPEMPKFNAMEYRYFYNLTIEKLNHILEDSILKFVNEKKQNVLLMINENWYAAFSQMNNCNDQLFTNIVHLIDEEIQKYYSSGAILTSSSGENHEGEESGKLAGIDALLQMSSQEAPA